MSLEGQHAEIGDTIVMDKAFLNAYTIEVARIASKSAIDQYKIEKSKDEKLTVAQVAEQENCSSPTVLSWIKSGIRNGRKTIKLAASKKGKRDWIISRFDLNQFLEAKKL